VHSQLESLDFGLSASLRIAVSIQFQIYSIHSRHLCTSWSRLAVNSNNDKANCVLSQDADSANAEWVNIADVGVVFGVYGTAGGSTRYIPAADLDADGMLSIVDATILARAYGGLVFQ